jgi:two-component system, chemotaxis family, sensor kinase CheA
MNEFLKQFLIEARELVEQAVNDLLELEKAPDDAERFDNAFRGFHTLKGGAGIVEFAALQTAVHCAEDVFTAARAESRPLSARDVDNCLACLDQIAEWLDAIERTGDLPADADAGAVVARFTHTHTAKPDSAPPPAHASDAEWLDALLRKHPAAAPRAQTALRYRPDADSFFRQQDPLARIAALPSLLALDVAPSAPWPPLDDLDPFSCNLVITALLAAPNTEAATALGDELRRCDVETLASRPKAAAVPSLGQRAAELLDAQLQLLAAGAELPQPGRIASAGLVAANVLRHSGRLADADAVAAAATASLAAGRPQPLVDAIRSALDDAAKPAAAEPAVARRQDSVQTLRVGTDRIDALVRLTGELTVAKNAIGHGTKLTEAASPTLGATLKNQHATLERLVGELQRAVVGMRVLPLRVAFQRFPRLIREMSAELGKPATLVLEGEDTEADKAIVEVLVEPLVHVLRNAMDHGVEPAPVRAAAGKPAVATLRVRAFRQGEHVLIEVTDDGAGIDLARVRQVAEERNVMPAKVLAAASDEDIIDLIFAPGFSTATTVTAVSGRGVGMDVVRTALSRLGGRVEARTTRGQGTTIRFTLPFSVLITQVMTVEAGGQTFGIPLDAVVETLRVGSERIFPVGAAHAIVLRNRTVPLVRLGQVLAQNERQHGDEPGPIVIAKVDGHLGALQVDRIGERMDVMLKPLDGLLAGLPGIAGSTLLGDGSVLLVLDLAELIQ